MAPTGWVLEIWVSWPMQAAAPKTRERHKPETFARISTLLQIHDPGFSGFVLTIPELKGAVRGLSNPKIATRSSTRQEIGLGCFTGLIRPCYIFCFQLYAEPSTATRSVSGPAVCRCCYSHCARSDASATYRLPVHPNH